MDKCQPIAESSFGIFFLDLGKGPSIWDEFTHQYPNKIIDKSNADHAANSYELFEDDIQMIKDMGVS